MKLRKLIGLAAAAAIAAAALIIPSGASAASTFTGSYFGTGFDSYDWGKMEASDGWSNGGMFDCTWSKDNVQFSGGKMNLSITPEVILSEDLTMLVLGNRKAMQKCFKI